MLKRSRFSLALAAVLTLGAAPSAPPELDLSIALSPATSRISVVAKLRGITCTAGTARLWLNRGLTVESAKVDRRAVTPVLDAPGAGRIFISAARAIDLPCPRETVELAYSGPGALHPDGRNQVSPRYIELSYYGAWYPLTADERRRSWRLQTQLPKGWTYASDGRVMRARAGLTIESRSPADVVLVALADVAATSARDRARVLIPRGAAPASRATAFALGREAAATAAWLTRLLGPSGAPSGPVLVFAPRSGPLSYARLPMIVTPQASLETPDDRPLALNIRHEVAHFWSRSVGPANDWLNEGIAEYLALVRTRDAEGDAAQAAVLDRYRREVAAAGEGVAILDTATDERRGYVNRYQRVPLLLAEVERRAGRPAVETLLRRAFGLGSQLSSSSFERVTSEALARAEAALIAQCLRARDWPAECGGLSPPS